jgi:hypothetical protein
MAISKDRVKPFLKLDSWKIAKVFAEKDVFLPYGPIVS